MGSSRLKDWDYSADGYYFVTICTQNRENIFGKIKNGKMRINRIGEIIKEEWQKTPNIRKNIKLDEWVIMPNHLHGILVIDNQNLSVETPRRGVSNNGNISTKKQIPNPHHKPEWKSGSIGAIINQFKSICTKRIHQIHPALDRVWQSRFYDHIIRDETELNCVRNYIILNPKH